MSEKIKIAMAKIEKFLAGKDLDKILEKLPDLIEF
jgi:DNA-binding SARP family transcriptional activator